MRLQFQYTARTNQSAADCDSESASAIDHDGQLPNGAATLSPFRNEASSSPTSSSRRVFNGTLLKAMLFLLLLGATGRTGHHVVSELVSQCHTAVALVRYSGSLTPRPGFTVVTGSPQSRSDMKSALSAALSLTLFAAITTSNEVCESTALSHLRFHFLASCLTRAPMFARLWSMPAFIAL